MSPPVPGDHTAGVASHPAAIFRSLFVDATDAQPASSVRAYFIGSGRIGVPVLEALIATAHVDLCGVATQPDRPSGRRRAVAPTPIAEYAATRGLSVAQPPSVNDPAFLKELSALSPEIIVVFSFGQLLKETVLTLPEHGCLNIHTSLLPRHRGAAPLAAAILAGDAETGVCFMEMEKGLDSGPVYDCVRTPLDGRETSASLCDRLGHLAASRIVALLQRICRSGERPRPQAEEGASYARQLRKSDARLDWGKAADRLEREIRAYYPWPCSWFLLPGRKGSRRIQVLDAAVLQPDRDAGTPVPGSVVASPPGSLQIACGEKHLQINSVVPEGRKRMTAEDFLRGTAIESGTILPALDKCP